MSLNYLTDFTDFWEKNTEYNGRCGRIDNAKQEPHIHHLQDFLSFALTFENSDDRIKVIRELNLLIKR